MRAETAPILGEFESVATALQILERVVRVEAHETFAAPLDLTLDKARAFKVHGVRASVDLGSNTPGLWTQAYGLVRVGTADPRPAKRRRRAPDPGAGLFHTCVSVMSTTPQVKIYAAYLNARAPSNDLLLYLSRCSRQLGSWSYYLACV